ncbi:MAG: hypothetical protein HND58_07435 [Planctomycetota bacterium]|nr:MAG: hypothetical protein HND58_07435 [Planctomycetota bacterium]
MPLGSHARDGHDIFEILVRENAAMLTAFLRSSLHDPSDVDDLFQETMVVAWRRIDDYDRSRPFGPWLRGIARNLVLAHYRKAAAAPRWCTPEVLEGIDRRFGALLDQGRRHLQGPGRRPARLHQQALGTPA